MTEQETPHEPAPTPPEQHPTGAPPVGAVLDRPKVEEPTAPDKQEDSTVGTGTSIALGCIAGTIVLIVIGLIFLGIVALIN